MAIVQRMRAELKDAMKSRDAVRTNFLRYWIAQLTTGTGEEVPDDQAVKKMRGDLFASLDPEQGRSSVTFTQRLDEGSVLRNRNGAGTGDFPRRWLRDGAEDDLGNGQKAEGGKPDPH